MGRLFGQFRCLTLRQAHGFYGFIEPSDTPGGA
jgi:hypothetical protein